MRRRCKAPVQIGEVLSAVLEQAGVAQAVREQEVLAKWPEIVGSAVADHARPKSLSGGVLFLTVENGAWRSQLFALKKEIIRKINDFAGKRIVKNIFFQ